LKIDTKGRGGGTLNKKVEVVTNDPDSPTEFLTITGTVDVLYTLSPKRVRLEGVLGTGIKQTVTLETQEKYPLKLVEVRAKNGDNIQYKLAEEKEGDITRYKLTIESIRKDVGSFVDTLLLKTDNATQPEIEIPIFGNVTAMVENTKQ
jgi:hypothetical protein